MAAQILCAQELRDLLDYNPDTGVFTYRRSVPRRKAGAPAGGMNDGYLRIRFAGMKHPAHRLAWLYVHGCMPSMDIDHIDGDRMNNRISNLREATRSVNAQNLHKPTAQSESGWLGVTKHFHKFQARIRVDGKLRHIGSFKTPEEAHSAYLEAKRRHHVGCTI